MAKIIRLFMLMAALVLFTVACSKDTETSEGKVNEPEEQENPITEEEEDPVLYRYPLTGLPSEEQPEHRAISVMINNHPSARPQSGLPNADLVFEILAEGGVTRFLAIYQSDMPDVVGPVRSARDYYIELAKGYDSLFIAHGYSPKAKEMLDGGYVDHINGMQYDGTLFKRANFRVAPHNSYITYENIVKGAEKIGYSLTGAPEGYTFLEDGEDVTGIEAPTVTVDYSDQRFQVRYEYDPVSEVYTRLSANEITADYETGEEVFISNIFIVEMDHAIIDNEGRRRIDITSGGKALLAQKGKIQEIEWENVDGKIVPISAGSDVPLVPGKTWINVVPDIEDTVFYEGLE